MRYTGILVPLVTPFDSRGNVDVATLKHLCETLIKKGVAGFVACGTTGEYYALNETERHTVLSTIADVAKGRVHLLAGINDMSTTGACQRAKEADALGYEGLMLSPTPYSLPDQAAVIQHYKTVAKATDLPIILYNFPARIGIEIEYDTILELAKHPNIVGIKESSGDFSRALRLLLTPFDDFEIICGCDDQPIDFFFWGAKSWIAGAANVFPGEQVALFEATQNQDWERARSIMCTIYPAIHSMESGYYNQKAKLGCVNHTIPVGPVRLPLTDMPKREKEQFLAFFK